MRALVKVGHGDREIEVREVPEPAAVPGRVLVQVEVAGICGSDVHLWRNSQSWEVKIPVVLGHEMAGRIVDTGGLDGFAVGERVVCETAESVCGRCAYCRTGSYNLCPHRRGYGAMADGAFARLVSVRPEIVHRIPDNVPTRHAALTEPVCVAYNALVERVRIVPGDLVVIQGAGAIGIMAAQIARVAGAGTIVVLGTSSDDYRLAVAQQVGAHHVMDVGTGDPADLVAGLGDGHGADVVVDCTGVSAALGQSLALVRPLGTVAKIGWGPQPVGLSLDPLIAKAATLVGSFSHTYRTWERVLTLMNAGALYLDAVIGGSYALDDWEDGFARMADGRNVKSVLTGF